jgi:HK97 family phage major capsid protein
MKFNATELKELNAACEKAFTDMQDQVKRVQDTAENAREEVRKEGTLHSETSKQLSALGESTKELSGTIKELKDRMRDVEQASAKRPTGVDSPKSLGQTVIESEQFKQGMANYKAKKYHMDAVDIGSFHNTAISGVGTSTTGTTGQLVQPERVSGIIMPGLRRMTIRNLLSQGRTDSNMIEFVKENVFTNNAGPQYDTTSPTPQQEGAVKNESGITFTLTQVGVTTLAHWIPASRQILADAPGLQSYVDGRLRYGLMLEEEDEMLNSSGANGELNGLNNQATVFTGGVTNQTALDTLLKAFTQISLSEFDATGVILHPNDWRDILLLKDTTGRYLFADPHGMTEPKVWGKDVVATQSQTSGTFTAGNFILAAEIFDREDASVRVSDQHADFFTRNMVAVLAEERLALVVYRAAAIVKGNLSFAG